MRFICNVTYFLGDLVSKLPQRLSYFWYPVYNWLMSVSCELSVKHNLDIWTTPNVEPGPMYPGLDTIWGKKYED